MGKMKVYTYVSTKLLMMIRECKKKEFRNNLGDRTNNPVAQNLRLRRFRYDDIGGWCFEGTEDVSEDAF